MTLVYLFQSEDAQPLRLKVEMNTREHFTVEGLKEVPFAVDSRWYKGSCSILSYELNDRNFASDIGPLLASGYEWDLVAMSEKVNDSLISRLYD